MSTTRVDRVPDAVTVPAGSSCADVVATTRLPMTGPNAIVAVRDADGLLRDLSWKPGRRSRSFPFPCPAPTA